MRFVIDPRMRAAPGLALILAIASVPVLSAPHVPDQDSAVLERLPISPGDPIARELRELRRQVAANPQDSATAVRLARRYFRLAMSEGDPRFIGYGEAALRPWWPAADAMQGVPLPKGVPPPQSVPPPPGVLVARALLRQYKHEFDAALEDLARAGEADPRDDEVWLWRSALHLVQADYAAAAADCARLRPWAAEVDITGCETSVQGMTGHAEAAYRALGGALQHARDLGPLGKIWFQTRLAEFSLRLGNTAVAEAHFREALALKVNDQYLLADYADFLLEQRRPAEVVPLLANWVRSDILLLRLAFAERALKLPSADAHVEALAARFAAAALRGERLHLAEESRFTLGLLGKPAQALALALDNWRAQREPRDARVVLEAAIAAREPQAAAPVMQWLQSSANEDPTLRGLAAQIEARSGAQKK
jgi:tetratricopeptide (TPR) repeat protein